MPRLRRQLWMWAAAPASPPSPSLLCCPPAVTPLPPAPPAFKPICFLSPVDSALGTVNTFKAGRPVPLSFRLEGRTACEPTLLVSGTVAVDFAGTTAGNCASPAKVTEVTLRGSPQAGLQCIDGVYTWVQRTSKTTGCFKVTLSSSLFGGGSTCQAVMRGNK